MAIPMLVGVAVVPGLIARLGPERFGALVLAWSLIGYFGLLDLGLGKGLTQYLARRQVEETPAAGQAAIAYAARRIMLLIGLGWAVLLAAISPWIASLLRIPAPMHAEAQQAWLILALNLPLLMWSTCCIAALESRSRFAVISGIRLPQGVATFLLPWAMAYHTDDLRAIIAGLLVVRLVTAVLLAWCARREFRAGPLTPAGHLRQLLAFGGWLTVSNLVGPLLSYFDRFAIAALLSITAVTQYTVPFDALTRLPSVAAAMMGVLFPLLTQAQALRQQASHVIAELLHSATQLLLAFWLPCMVLLAALGPWILHAWVPALAEASTPAWHCLAVGVAVNGFAHLPFSLLQSAGRTDQIARIHLCELPLYGLGLWWGLVHWGIVGAAIAWSSRVVVDCVLLTVCAYRQLPEARRPLLRILRWATGLGTLLTLLAWHPPFPHEQEAAPKLATLLGAGLCAVVWCTYHVRLLRPLRRRS